MNKNLFSKARVEVPHVSGFDKSFQSLFTLPVGTLVPMIDEIPANTKVNLNALVSASLPPLVSDVFMRCSLNVEAFFIPFRQLYAGWQYWLTGEKVRVSASSEAVPKIPYLALGGDEVADYFGPGSLADYLGAKFTSYDLNQLSESDAAKFSIFPFMAYHWVWDEWYRNKSVTVPIFRPSRYSASTFGVTTLPYIFLVQNSEVAFTTSNCSFLDGSTVFDLRQRCFGLDYFSSAKLSPQSGDAQKVQFSTSGTVGEFTIASLRSANSLQQFRERQNLASDDYCDYLSVNYDAHLTAGQANKPMYLGSGVVNVYSKGIDQTQNGTAGSSVTTNNPFDTVGARYGSAYCNGQVNLIDNFHAQEPGYIMVMFSLVPRASYSTGVDPVFTRYLSDGDQTHMANPVLQNVGQQPIYSRELAPLGHFSSSGSTVFGYQDRFADFMSRNDEVHGLLRNGESLDNFALQRAWRGTDHPTLTTNFGYIPTTFLDEVAAAQYQISDYGAWVDCFFDYKVVMPLHQFSIPSLENVHGKDVYVQRGGTVIR